MTDPALAYFDTSALLKRYVRERGSARVQRLARQFRVLTSTLTSTEGVSALTRRHRAGDLSAVALADVLTQLREDRNLWRLVEVTTEVLATAETIIVQTNVRTLDAIHLASARLVNQILAGPRPLPFITADAVQRKAARDLQLSIRWVD